MLDGQSPWYLRRAQLLWRLRRKNHLIWTAGRNFSAYLDSHGQPKIEISWIVRVWQAFAAREALNCQLSTLCPACLSRMSLNTTGRPRFCLSTNDWDLPRSIRNYIIISMYTNQSELPNLDQSELHIWKPHLYKIEYLNGLHLSGLWTWLHKSNISVL